MKVQVIVFGQLKDITGTDRLIVDDIADTKSLVGKLQSMYPALADSKYAIALDKKVINENTILREDNIIALLPPFSGG